MQSNPLANEQVYSFFSDTVIVTKRGNIATAVLAASPVSNFKSGDSFVATPFLQSYPELLPKKEAISSGLMYNANADNYIALIDISPAGNLFITYKNTISGRATSLVGNSYSIYGVITWITN